MLDTARAVETATMGLFMPHKSLPAWLLYDDAGCALYEQITQLPEYYLTRSEAEIFERHGDEMISIARDGERAGLAELGAGTATKTEILLGAAVRAQTSCVYLACDLAPVALDDAVTRIGRALPQVDVRTFVGTHAQARCEIRALADRQILLFIGSSVGNYVDEAAVELLRSTRAALRPDATLILGTDLATDPGVHRAAYDDSAGVTAAFSKNILVRLNREIGSDFDVDAFRHVTVWNSERCDVEIYLESRRSQRVRLGVIGRDIELAEGERIHTETSAKYDLARVDRILEGAAFRRVMTFLDERERYAVHLARVAAT